MSGPPDYGEYPNDHNHPGQSYVTGDPWTSLPNHPSLLPDPGYEALSNWFYNTPNPYQSQEPQQYRHGEPPNHSNPTLSVANHQMDGAPVRVRPNTQNNPPATRQSV